MNTFSPVKKQALFPILTLIALIPCANAQQQRADPDFDTSLPKPTFVNDLPVVLFDEGHKNFHTTTGLYLPFAKLIQADGYILTTLSTNVTDDALSGVDIYVIANARGDGDANDEPAFTQQECESIKHWVTNGGSLLFIADHFPFGAAAQRLGDEFGIDFQKGMAADSLNYDLASEGDYSRLEFSTQNNLLHEHPITQGVSRVITFTGQSIACRNSCFSFMTLSPSAFDLTPVPTIIKDGDNTRVQVNYENPVSAHGRSQGIAMEVGKGRIVVLGEAAMLTAQKNRRDENIGMNYNPDNKILALNIMHWLTKS